jgi:hypothetical protein
MMRNSEINKKFDIFLSYQWNKKHLVKQLYNKLKEEYNLALWLDEQETDASGNLFEQLAKGLNNSKIVLCFITREYCKSENCISEITYARDNCIPIIVLMMERLNLKEIGSVGFIIASKTRLNFYKETDDIMWSGEMFEMLIKSIKNFFNLVNKESSRIQLDSKITAIEMKTITNNETPNNVNNATLSISETSLINTEVSNRIKLENKVAPIKYIKEDKITNLASNNPTIATSETSVKKFENI